MVVSLWGGDERALLAKRSRQAGAQVSGAKRVLWDTRARRRMACFAPLLRHYCNCRYFFAPLLVFSLGKF
jgi:hypothetical protein